MLVLMLDLYDRNTFKFDQKKWNNDDQTTTIVSKKKCTIIFGHIVNHFQI